jgi:hypothetical protein
MSHVVPCASRTFARGGRGSLARIFSASIVLSIGVLAQLQVDTGTLPPLPAGERVFFSLLKIDHNFRAVGRRQDWSWFDPLSQNDAFSQFVWGTLKERTSPTTDGKRFASIPTDGMSVGLGLLSEIALPLEPAT